MKTVQKIATSFALLCLFTFSFSSASAEGMKKDVSVGVVFSASGSSQTNNATFFTGSASMSGGPEITGTIKPFEQVQDLFVAGRLSSESYEHCASFIGTSIGCQKRDTSITGMIGWDFTPEQPIDIRFSVGVKHFLNSTGQYAIGGAAFATQTQMANTVGTAELQASANLGRISQNLKDVSLGGYVRYSGAMKSSVTPVAGFTVESQNDTNTFGLTVTKRF